MTQNKNKHFNTYKEGHLQGGAGPGVPAGVLHGARGAARDGAGRDAGGGRCCETTECLVEGHRRAGTVGGLRGAGLLQVHGSPLGDEGDAWLVQERRGGINLSGNNKPLLQFLILVNILKF